MQSQGNGRWAWAAGIALLVAGAVGIFLMERATPPKTSQPGSMPAMAMPNVSAEPPAQVAEIDVIIPDKDLDRLQLKFAKVTEGLVQAEIRVPGTTQPNAYKQVRVTPLVGGLVTQVTVELGQPVKRGQALVQVFSRELAEAQASYVSFNAELEAEHKKLVRTQELVRLGAASRQEMEEVEATHLAHAAHVEEARQRLLLLGVDEDKVGRPSNSNIAVPSPLDGIVTARGVNVGQVVSSGQDLLTVTDLSSIWIEASLFENDFGAVRVGSRATISTAAYAGREYRGTVEYIDPQVDPQTRTAKVRIAVDNPGLSLRLGMYMDVLFTSSAGARVPIVPKQAVQLIGPASVVYVPVEGEPGRFLQRAVKTGQETSGGIVVLEGLKPGETVVAEGSFLIRAEAVRQHP
ncbi:MAG: efflux RND transporter periplasmic adaptor subunit [Bryobacteraceae bacterium]